MQEEDNTKLLAEAKKWKILYPLYVNSNFSREQGIIFRDY